MRLPVDIIVIAAIEQRNLLLGDEERERNTVYVCAADRPHSFKSARQWMNLQCRSKGVNSQIDKQSVIGRTQIGMLVEEFLLPRDTLRRVPDSGIRPSRLTVVHCA